MIQLTLFPEEKPDTTMRIRVFSTFEQAAEFAINERATGRYEEIYLTKFLSTTRVVLIEPNV